MLPRLPESRCLHFARGEQTTGQLLPSCRMPAPQEPRLRKGQCFSNDPYCRVTRRNKLVRHLHIETAPRLSAETQAHPLQDKNPTQSATECEVLACKPLRNARYKIHKVSLTPSTTVTCTNHSMWQMYSSGSRDQTLFLHQKSNSVLITES